MAACFIKVKNNAELDLHVTKYDKNYCEIRIFLFERRIIDRCSMWLGRALRSMISSLLFPKSDHCVPWDNLSNQPQVPHLSSSPDWWIDSLPKSLSWPPSSSLDHHQRRTILRAEPENMVVTRNGNISQKCAIYDLITKRKEKCLLI